MDVRTFDLGHHSYNPRYQHIVDARIPILGTLGADVTPCNHLQQSFVIHVSTDPRKENDMSKEENRLNGHGIIHNTTVNISLTHTPLNRTVNTATLQVKY